MPHVHLVRDDGDLVGGPFMISDFVAGRDRAPPGAAPRRRAGQRRDRRPPARRVAGPAARHRPGAVAVPLRTARAPRRAGRRRPRRARRPSSTSCRSAARRSSSACAGWSGSCRRRRRGETIVHTDVRNGNLIIGEDGLRAVLDWEGALASGDPMQDLAWPALRMWRFREDDQGDRRLRRPGAVHRRLRGGRRRVRRGPLPVVEGRGHAALGRRPRRPDDGASSTVASRAS